MFIKVCGLKEKKQIDKAIELGYNAIGVVVYPKSKRYCSDEKAIELARYAKGRIKSFVVSVKFEEVKKVASHFDFVQVYEKADIDNLAFSSKDHPEETRCRYFVYDASLGSGEFKDFPIWLKDVKQPVIVAGGLTKYNVKEVIEKITPFGVDVSSGVEKNGIKDFGLMEDFIKAVRE